ncbi:hypothetical protein [Mucilaginibacter rubeus]|uniref:Outer membrane protein beta-barrel domain-containing protein n=1 Tax=Mucilaginibacter rubeus TaxID=2027860 RepID=A0A5C1I7Z3_9SPHI|nr:hypothetical protein [Mucilaginibacter rubeus]QEM13826.1 hypothetical protein DEO27_028680 [Mucilaginibacter rubeus]
MKKYFLLFVLVCATVMAKAQSGYNYYEWGFGGGVNYARGFDDLKKQVWHPGGTLNLTYNYSPYVPIALDFHFGTLEGGGLTPAQDEFGRKSKNNFLALALRADMQMGEIIDYENSGFLNVVKNFYVGAGIGAIKNKMAFVQRSNPPGYENHGPVGDPEGFQGKDKSINLMIPLRLGYEFKIYDDYDQVGYTITLGVQHSYTFGEGLDGYNDNPQKYKNNAPDQFVQYSIGFKYNFGNTVSYTKLVRNFR